MLELEIISSYAEDHQMLILFANIKQNLIPWSKVLYHILCLNLKKIKCFFLEKINLRQFELITSMVLNCHMY